MKTVCTEYLVLFCLTRDFSPAFVPEIKGTGRYEDLRMEERYLQLLAREYPNRQAALCEITNLTAMSSLPKGTEHFMSDLHGEYEAFCHILNNCSGGYPRKSRPVVR